MAKRLFKIGAKGRPLEEQARLPGAWYGKIRLDIRDHRRVKLCNDAELSRSWLRELQNACDRKRFSEPVPMDRLKGIPRESLERLGLVNKLAETRRRSWNVHVDDYCSELTTRGASAKYVSNARLYLRAIGPACEWSCLSDVDRDEFHRYVEKRKSGGASPRTLNNIRATLKSFMAWAVRARRADDNPIGLLGKVDERQDRRRVRRAMNTNEVLRLFAVAGARVALYRFALSTGLRRRELGLLEWRDVRMDDSDSERPYLALRPEATKSKRADEVPLSGTAVRLLRGLRPVFFLPTKKVFSSASTLETWQADLRRAGIDYRDSQGRIAGFHSLRVTLGTNLEQIGTPRAVRHWIMRHVDPSVSYTSYVDRQRLDAWEWINRLPAYEPAEFVQLKRTGTDNVHIARPDQKPDQLPCSNVHFDSIQGAIETNEEISRNVDLTGVSACFETVEENSPSRTRTYNLAVNSRSLYH